MPFDLGRAWSTAWRTGGMALSITAPVPPLAIVAGLTAGTVAFVTGGLAPEDSVDAYNHSLDEVAASLNDDSNWHYNDL